MFAARPYTAALEARSQCTGRRVIWLLMGLAALLPACSDKDTVTRLDARKLTYLEGVPVPSGFNLVSKMTEDYESGGQRTARHEYSGLAEPQAVRNFYREQMPALGWMRVADQNVKGTIGLRFERRDEACTIEIKRDWYLATTVQVIVNPFSRAEAPRQPVP